MSKVVVAKQAKISEIDENEITQNFEQSIKLMRWLFKLMGMWPNTSSIYRKILRLLLIVVVLFFQMGLIVPVVLYTIIVVKDFQIRLRCLGPLSFGIMSIFKFYSVLAQDSRLRECVKWMATDWRSVGSRIENDLMLKNSKTAKTFTIICVTGVYMGCMSYSTLFSFMMDPIVVNNRTTRVFAYPGHFVFFDPHAHFLKVYTLHVISCFVQCTIACAVASIAIVCVMHVCGQIAMITWMLSNTTPGYFDNAAFGRIVDKHLRAIAFAKKLEGYLSRICLCELMGSSFNICMLGYYFITRLGINDYLSETLNRRILHFNKSYWERGQSFVVYYTYCVLLMSFTFNIFIFCYIGDQLTEKCDIVGNVAYNVDWYNFSAKDAKNLLLIILSSQRPIVLTAGKMTTLSMTCFSSVIKASFSYLNMLRTVTMS